jgi:hypothetical protein
LSLSISSSSTGIVVPEDIDHDKGNVNNIYSEPHEYTFGINSDALAHTVAFLTLIHDGGHRGIPKGQLGKGLPDLGEKYKHRSITEQSSVDLACNLLMNPQYKDLKQCIFTNGKKESWWFRQYIVNLVMATAIFKKRHESASKLEMGQGF